MKAHDDLASGLDYLLAEDRSLVERAVAMASRVHEGQHRKSGDAFITHPLAVAQILAELRMDGVTLAAAILHDSVEDTSLSLAEIERELGAEVASLVDGVTKLTQLEDSTHLEAEAENLRKMFLAMAQDVRVMMIKLADRLHNMRTLKPLSLPRQKAIAQETLEIFAPLAHRLGMSRLKWELEDLALRHLDPVAYRDIADKVADKRKEREAQIAAIVGALTEALEQHGIRAEVQGRPKSFYSIYQKIKREGRDFKEIYDLIAVRVLVDSARECYGVLGIVHTLFTPIPGRFKDYVAMPKSNLYQSLHTTVLGADGRPFEVQIRTMEMHHTAEYGIAAHWIYKEGQTDPRFNQRLAWLRQVLEIQGDVNEPHEFFESMKVDLFSDEVFVFTPKGMVLELPRGATPIDFAYRIHTDVGHRTIGAKANGHIVTLDYQLRNGDIIEVITSKTARGPSADWLQFANTSTAKNRIRQWFKVKNREENVRQGRDLLEREARRLGLDPELVVKEEWLTEIGHRHRYGSADDLLAAIGYGGFSVGQVISKLREKLPPAPPELIAEPAVERVRRPANASSGIVVQGADNLLVHLAGCCSPVPGESIVGYVSRGRGITIHRTDCYNLRHLEQDSGRLVEVHWAGAVHKEATGSYTVEIEVRALDRSGLLADVATILAANRVNILSARARGYRNATAAVTVVVEIKNIGELSRLIEQLGTLPEVISVQRVARQKAT
ncbi:MAG: RelA/SpoT family protein [Sulfobacillus sp.]